MMDSFDYQGNLHVIRGMLLSEVLKLAGDYVEKAIKSGKADPRSISFNYDDEYDDWKCNLFFEELKDG